jgi:hypothetical protein
MLFQADNLPRILEKLERTDVPEAKVEPDKRQRSNCDSKSLRYGQLNPSLFFPDFGPDTRMQIIE